MRGAETCGRCVFFMPRTDIVATASQDHLGGFCRYNPPSVVSWMEPAIDPGLVKPGSPVKMTLKIEPAFPPTLSSSWCGQYVAVAEYEDYQAARGRYAEDDLNASP